MRPPIHSCCVAHLHVINAEDGLRLHEHPPGIYQLPAIGVGGKGRVGLIEVVIRNIVCTFPVRLRSAWKIVMRSIEEEAKMVLE